MEKNRRPYWFYSRQGGKKLSVGIVATLSVIEMTAIDTNDCSSVGNRMTCVRQRGKFKAHTCEDTQQYGLKHASLVGDLGTGASRRPDRKCDNFCLFPDWLKICPTDEWQVSPVVSNGDITMIQETFTADRSIGSGNYPLKKTVADSEVKA